MVIKKNKVICIGEALIDRIKNKDDDNFTDFLGGAPANVACALRKLKIDSVFIGRLGDDAFGKEFVNQFKELSVNINFLQFDKELPTRIVKVNRDISGDRYFSGFDGIINKGFSDQAIDKNLLEKDVKKLEELFQKTKYFVSGTILLTSLKSAEAVNFLFSKAQEFDVNIIIDLNWREVFWDDSRFSKYMSNKERINLVKDFLEYANTLKLAKEEAILFFESKDPLEISETILNRPDVIITDGSNPIEWFISGVKGTTEVCNELTIVDTTGAGDAFLAGLISQLITLDSPLKEFQIQNCVKYASLCGLLTCLAEGAIKPQPDYLKVDEFIGSRIV